MSTTENVIGDLDSLIKEPLYSREYRSNKLRSIRTRIAALLEAIGPAKYWDHAIGDDDRICVPAASCRKISAALKAIGHG